MPESWKSMEFKLEIAGEPIRFYITSDKVSLLSETDISHPINVNIGGTGICIYGKVRGRTGYGAGEFPF